MSAYGAIASWYDALTRDVDYAAFADWFDARLRESGRAAGTVLDLACGTGTLTCLLALRGYEMIGVDGSGEMLAAAAEKTEALGGEKKPLLLCQELAELDLYGTVDAAICCLDGMNYVPPSELAEVFRRLRLFIEPGGPLLFDLLSPDRLRAMDGAVLIDETEALFCVWRGELDDTGPSLIYGMDIFSKVGKVWRRDTEEHIEYVHEPESVAKLLRETGFTNVQIRRDGPQSGAGRIFFTAIRG